MAEAHVSGSRYIRDLETIINSSSGMHVEQEIEVAHPRATFEIRKTAEARLPLPAGSPAFSKCATRRSSSTRPSRRRCSPRHAHPVVAGWIERVIGWMDTKLETLSRYAADPSSGGGLQTFDYFMLQMLNREINVVKHMRASQFVHPGRVLQGTAADFRRALDVLAQAPRAGICRLRPGCARNGVRAGAVRHPAAAQPRHRPRHPPRPGREGAQRLSSPRCPTARCSATPPSSSRWRRRSR